MLTGRKQARAFDEFEDESSPSTGWPPLSIIRILWKSKIPLLATWAVLSAGVLVAVWLWPATYKAETLILVDQQKIPEKFVSSTVNTELQDRLATISQEILSSTRLQKIIDRYKLYENDRKNHVQEEILEMMRADIKVVAEKGWIQNRPGAFRVSYEGRNPSTVAEVTNQLGNLFIEENLRSRETIAEGTSDFMKSQLADAKKNLEEQEKKLSQFKLEYNGELPQQEASLAQELSRLELQLQGNQDAINRASQNKITLESSLSVAQSTETTLKRLMEASAEISKRPPGSRAIAADGTPAKKKSELLQEQLSQLLVKDSPKHPDVVMLKQAIEQAKALEAEQDAQAAAAAARAKKQGESKKEDEAKGDLAQEATPQNAQAVQALSTATERITLIGAQLTAINTELKTRQADHQKIVAQMDAIQARLHRLPLREQEMAEVTRDYETSKANYDSLQNKIFAADMATEMERRQKSERFTVLDPAQIPEKPISPNRPLFAGVGCGLALALSMGAWLFAGIRKNKFLGEWELPDGVVVLGRVPPLPAGGTAR